MRGVMRICHVHSTPQDNSRCFLLQNLKKKNESMNENEPYNIVQDSECLSVNSQS